MIVEQAVITVAEGKEESFETAFAEAKSVMASSPGCQSVQLYRCIEEPERFLLFVEWDSVEAHMEGFRKSAAFDEWREIVGPYFAYLSDMSHYRPVGQG
ncbi:MAG TPA: antibiotic biosynthesis monooxygenase family protein [Acidimicrobiales bacterium]|nr:antibiotic biosynthesis monooxygenase family protein [Acidimicrobiales bacterium]